jgi:hypothetical protein
MSRLLAGVLSLFVSSAVSLALGRGPDTTDNLPKPPEQYVFCVDGKETWRTKAGGVCQVPVYILLSDEIGKWAGDITKAKLPDKFLVDYVRVYDLTDTK